MGKHTCIVKIVGEPALTKVKAYREAVTAQERAWNEYGNSVGASGFPKGWPGHPPGFMFFENGPQPAGWKKPDRHGRSNPKKGSAAAAALASLPVRPSVRGVLTGIVNDLNYKGADLRGSGMVAFFEEGYAVGWVGDMYFARIPHAGRAAADHLARNPDHTIDGPANGWTIPEGLVEISEAEFDLITAEHRVKLERERVSTAEAA